MRHRITSRLAVSLVAAALTAPAAAQERPAPVADVAAGWVGFADDGVVSEGLVGGAVRWYVTPRLAIGPEVLFISGSNHSHFVATANVTWDVLFPRGGRPRHATPFLVAGGGLFQTREQFPVGAFTSGEGAFTAGGGVRVVAGDRVTIGADARIGWELHLRINGVAGVRLGR